MLHDQMGDGATRGTNGVYTFGISTVLHARVEAIELWPTGQWSEAYGWGDHAVAGYATGLPVYAETDPVWTAEKSGYATGLPVYAETDPVWSAEKAGYATGLPVYAEADAVWTAAQASGFSLGGNLTMDGGTNIAIVDGETWRIGKESGAISIWDSTSESWARIWNSNTDGADSDLDAGLIAGQEVDAVSPSAGQTLKYVGGVWTNAPDATGDGGGAASETTITNTAFAANPFDGTTWASNSYAYWSGGDVYLQTKTTPNIGHVWWSNAVPWGVYYIEMSVSVAVADGGLDIAPVVDGVTQAPILSDIETAGWTNATYTGRWEAVEFRGESYGGGGGNYVQIGSWYVYEASNTYVPSLHVETIDIGDDSNLATGKVAKTGDTMTGTLSLYGVETGLYVNSSGPIYTTYWIDGVGNFGGLNLGAASISLLLNGSTRVRIGGQYGSSWVTAGSSGSGVAIGSGANASSSGAAVGYRANAAGGGVAVGNQADCNGGGIGNIAVGYQANANGGTAVGYQANAQTYCVAVGYQACATETSGQAGTAIGRNALASRMSFAGAQNASAGSYGVAVGASADGAGGVSLGYNSNGRDGGACVGSSANAEDRGVAIGYQANGANTNVAIGHFADTGGSGGDRIAIGQYVTNSIDNSIAVRGDLYLDGATGLYARATFGSGTWYQVGVYITNSFTGGTMSVSSTDGVTGFWR